MQSGSLSSMVTNSFGTKESSYSWYSFSLLIIVFVRMEVFSSAHLSRNGLSQSKPSTYISLCMFIISNMSFLQGRIKNR